MNDEGGKLMWRYNIYAGDILNGQSEHELADKRFGEPRATPNYPQKYLMENGVVGVYGGDSNRVYIVDIVLGNRLYSLLKDIKASGTLSFASVVEAAVRLEIDLTNADMRGKALTGAYLVRGKFNGADFTGSVLDDANCFGASFVEANLRCLSVRNTDMRNTDCRRAKMDLMKFYNEARIEDMIIGEGFGKSKRLYSTNTY